MTGSDQALRELERRALEGDLAARDRLALEQTRRGRDEQQDALDVMLSGRSCFLTGPGGTGKSWCVRRFIDEKRKRSERVLVAATTGVAAVALGGTTLHRLVGLPVERVRGKKKREAPAPWDDAEEPGDFDEVADAGRVRPSAVVLQSYKQPWQRFTAPRLRFALREGGTFAMPGTLIVDETSMLSGADLDAASWLCAVARNRDEPFGGLQVIFVGDLGQLPPVDERFGWAPDAAAWRALDPVVLALTQARRQSDPEFAALLARIRLGELAPHDRAILASRVGAFDPSADPKPVRILSTNRECQAINEAELAKLPGPLRVRDAEEYGPAALLADLDRGCSSPRRLALKVGARVLLTANDPFDPPTYANGTAATVREIGVEIDHGDGSGEVGVAVETDDGREILVGMASWEIREIQNGVEVVAAYRRQLPLRLGFALTAHRAQGMSLDRVSVDLSHAFAAGQAYVALSRCRTLEGLSLESSKCGRLEAHPKFIEFERTRKPWLGVL